jgi:hypothetical protein
MPADNVAQDFDRLVHDLLPEFRRLAGGGFTGDERDKKLVEIMGKVLVAQIEVHDIEKDQDSLSI